MRTQYIGRTDHYTLSPVRPQTIGDAERAFPTDIGRLMPTQEEINRVPEDYLREAEDFVTTWFHLGLDRETRWVPAPGVDLLMALRHLETCMRSFEPKHEDKILGCACLVTRFFENVKYAPAPKDMRPTKWTSFLGFIYEVEDARRSSS